MQGLLHIILLSSVGIFLVSACPTAERHVEVDPNQPRLILKSGEGRRLIKTSEKEPAKWMNEEEVWSLVERHANFIDITDYEQFPVPAPALAQSHINAIPTTLRYQTAVRSLIQRLNINRVQQFVQTFSSYHNRYYQAATGQQSQQWLLDQIRQSVAGYAGTVSVNEILHSWLQRSIVVRIEGSDPTVRSQRVIIGAHQDSINTAGSSLGAPGADDNASGSVVVLETLRVLVEAGFIPKRTIEFHWYAAEEVGLRGSGDIARAYRAEGVNVVAMANFDVPGYYNGVNEVGIYTDNGNAQVVQLLRILVDEYLTYGRRDRTCGYGCSDHASWTNNGYPSAMPAEVTLHPLMHTVNDNIQRVGFTQVIEFAKLSLGFVVEVAEPRS